MQETIFRLTNIQGHSKKDGRDARMSNNSKNPLPIHMTQESIILENPAQSLPDSYWSALENIAITLIKTLPSCSSASLAKESMAMREELSRLVGIMEQASIAITNIPLPHTTPTA
ncbi:hypothetical protein UFOVP736_37 [uncultured Caudovirales phage]|uniref:Uncharacterized protein n=1 Tax=uncultured Caudovirales phage TaxID=2100421 RepID=A0A6J7X4A9_9CAUD|nr:hypothetical protein UFOVP705_44 [uncultured Caudovirales phage]CAB5224171.1 hypothetical protein UFOVP736_37 [uncultured Caudovirales phage]